LAFLFLLWRRDAIEPILFFPYRAFRRGAWFKDAFTGSEPSNGSVLQHSGFPSKAFKPSTLFGKFLFVFSFDGRLSPFSFPFLVHSPSVLAKITLRKL